MRIQHNLMSMNAYRYYNGNTKSLSGNLEKLSSGYKINRAADDAAGLAISEKMRAEITGLETAQSNAQSGINLVQTAEGALTEVHAMLNRMIELADQSANGTYDDETDRANLDKEFQDLSGEIDRISKSANFNGLKLLDGSMDPSAAVNYSPDLGEKANLGATLTITLDYSNKDINKMFNSTIEIDGVTYEFVKSADDLSKAGNTAVLLDGTETPAQIVVKLLAKVPTSTATSGYTVAAGGTPSEITLTKTAAANEEILAIKQDGGGLRLQIGGTADSCNQISIAAQSMSSESLKIDGLNVSDQSDAATAVDAIKKAINLVSETRGTFGAAQNRLEHTINNLSVMTENIQDAESSIRDVDVANEMMHYTKNNILVQSAQSMLAQANQAPQGVLQLLQ